MVNGNHGFKFNTIEEKISLVLHNETQKTE